MFDLGWGEILLCAVVALLVAGPEDVPRLMRSAGVLMGKVRRFGHSLEVMLDGFIAQSEAESGLTGNDPMQGKVQGDIPCSEPAMEEDEPDFHPPEAGGKAS
ncbi:MAG TPA: hypothetical protein DCW68_04510 [Rhodospirillaceae bacterium]|nr:MAG: hypothetical protein A2018_03140 [Alphaproteobacteria bacterium GWF2_58_20]HAU29359.1 hypothetical protein [Rhodospirillaceae bacterium]